MAVHHYQSELTRANELSGGREHPGAEAAAGTGGNAII